jgi:hypothetical protein
MAGAVEVEALTNKLTVMAQVAQDHLAQEQSYMYTHDKERG